MNALRRLVARLRRLALDHTLERSGDTRTPVALKELGVAEEGYHDYEPSGWRSLNRALNGVDFGPDDSFLDIGCGKGRVLAQAARLPFLRVIGVEVAAELADEARRLLAEGDGRRRCGSVEVVVADSTTWPIPTDVTVIYFYNALSGAPLQALLDRVADSAREVPRDISLLYVNPVHEAELLSHPRFELVRRIGGRRWAVSDPRRISVIRAKQAR
jgi:SAM-dependent methyltransferase